MLSPREMQFVCPFKKKTHHEHILYFYNKKTMPQSGVLISINGRIQESLKLCQVNGHKIPYTESHFSVDLHYEKEGCSGRIETER